VGLKGRSTTAEVKRFASVSRIDCIGYTLQYYDLVLSAIGASLGLGVLVGYVTSIPSPAAIVGFGGVAIAFIVHALFINGPVDDTEDLTEEVAIEEVPQVLSPMNTGPET